MSDRIFYGLEGQDGLDSDPYDSALYYFECDIDHPITDDDTVEVLEFEPIKINCEGIAEILIDRLWEHLCENYIPEHVDKPGRFSGAVLSKMLSTVEEICEESEFTLYEPNGKKHVISWGDVK